MAEHSIPNQPVPGETLADLGDGLYKMRSYTDPDLVYLVDVIANTCRREHDNKRCPATYSQAVCKYVRVMRVRRRRAAGGSWDGPS